MSLIARKALVLASALLCLTLNISAQLTGKTAYDQINGFSLSGGRAELANVVLKRDRATMTLNGTIYFTNSVGGVVTGAVFIGQGLFSATVPPSEFEKAQVKRLLNTDKIESDFSSAVFQFSDDTFEVLRANVTDGPASGEAQRLASEFENRTRKETGANVASRITESLLNQEDPGVFFGTFEGGKRGRFSYIFDPQGRIPTADFEINGGEKGLIYAYRSSMSYPEVWMAFYSLDDYARRSVTYSDVSDLIDVTNYSMTLDLRTPKSKLGLETKITMQSRFAGVRAIPFQIGESLDTDEDQRLKKQLRLKEARIGSNKIDFVQEDWESGFTVFVPTALAKGETIDLDLELEGDFLRQPNDIAGSSWATPVTLSNCSYPQSNSTWYPRHGYLDRATFDLTFLHNRKLKVASTGVRESETPSPEDREVMITKYKMSDAVPFATFALGPWERHPDQIKWEGGAKDTPLEFNSLSGSNLAIKEDFILAELNNSVRYFSLFFGQYPYESFSATFHPYGFGQGFATMLMIPPTDRATKYTYAFLSHETAHQWWGNVVAWRSYRDQWLSEGFAEYSGILYTQKRENWKAAQNLIDQMRRELKEPPYTLTGPGKGRLVDVGPIILGRRLEGRKTFGSYQALIYSKGALVLRMLHFLMTDPSTGDGKPFFDMMRDFVDRYRNKAASTDDFRNVANEHFTQTSIARKYGLKDLNWFFEEWVYQTALPSYTLEYTMQDQPDGSVLVSGDVLQEGAPENWFMVLPLVFQFGGDKNATGTVHAYGPKTPFQIKLPSKPTKVELDPNKWILSEKTSTR